MTRQEASRVIEALFDEWGVALFRHALRLGGDHDVADDLVQEAFMALFGALLRGQQVEEPRSWLLTVVRYRAASRLRWARTHPEQLEPPEAFDLLESLEPSADGERQLDDVTALFPVLTRREQEVLLLRMESRKYSDIAARLGIHHKTVSVLLARAVRKLRQATRTTTNGPSPRAGKERRVPQPLP